MCTLKIYTDGGSRGNPGPGGFGIYIENSGLRLRGFHKDTTNNIMELTAVKECLKYVILSGFGKLNPEIDKIRIYSDSSYVVNTFTQWIFNWISSGSIHEKKNKDLILEIFVLIQLLRRDEYTVTFIKVKGHSDCIGNNIADEEVNLAMDTESTTSYSVMFDKSYWESLCKFTEIGIFNRIFK